MEEACHGKKKKVHVIIFNDISRLISFCKIKLTYMSRKDIENLAIWSSTIISGDTTFPKMEW